MSALIQAVLRSGLAHWQFVRYVLIGSTVFCVDVGGFQIAIKLGFALALAATASYLVAILVHFTLNKYLNFRKHDRHVSSQAVTYAVVAFCLWLTTLAIVELGVEALHLSPLAAKVLAVIANVPLGFLGHRYLTFGPGILRTLRALPVFAPSRER